MIKIEEKILGILPIEEKKEETKVKYYKPKINTNLQGFNNNITTQYLKNFTEKTEHKPKNAKETCDLILDQLQPLMYVDPKKNLVNEINWYEPQELTEFWKSKEKILWALVTICSFILILLLISTGL